MLVYFTLKKAILFSHVTRRHRRVAPFNHLRGQMASGFHVFLIKHTDGKAHRYQVSKIAAPKRARQASLPALTPKSRTPHTSKLDPTKPQSTIK
jgi:hypothetical protein